MSSEDQVLERLSLGESLTRITPLCENKPLELVEVEEKRGRWSTTDIKNQIY